MSMMENAALLRNYVENGSDSAFGQLVSRYFDLVYSAALRLVAGDAHLAQDVAQTVFTDFARKARTLPADVLLGGWLYQHTCFTASKAVRSERRRQARERLAVEMNLQTDPPEVDWHQLAPVLEEAMSHLKTAD
jgi:DNA-directed RNA polymerase specialized sigma24 family protein